MNRFLRSLTSHFTIEADACPITGRSLPSLTWHDLSHSLVFSRLLFQLRMLGVGRGLGTYHFSMRGVLAHLYDILPLLIITIITFGVTEILCLTGRLRIHSRLVELLGAGGLSSSSSSLLQIFVFMLDTA